MNNYLKLEEASNLLEEAWKLENDALNILPAAVKRKFNNYFRDILERHAWMQEEIRTEVMILDMKSDSQHEKFYGK